MTGVRRFWRWMTKSERITGRMLQDYIDEVMSGPETPTERRGHNGGNER